MAAPVIFGWPRSRSRWAISASLACSTSRSSRAGVAYPVEQDDQAVGVRDLVQQAQQERPVAGLIQQREQLVHVRHAVEQAQQQGAVADLV